MPYGYSSDIAKGKMLRRYLEECRKKQFSEPHQKMVPSQFRRIRSKFHDFLFTHKKPISDQT